MENMHEWLSSMVAWIQRCTPWDTTFDQKEDKLDQHEANLLEGYNS